MARAGVGTPPSGFKSWDSIEVDFHGFADLPAARGERAESPEVGCLGNRWKLHVYPGGVDTAGDGMVSIVLINMSGESIEIDYFWSIRNASGKEVVSAGIFTNSFVPYGRRGWCEEFKRSKILKDLVDGSLTIEVKMRESSAPTKCSSRAFIPENPLNKNILRKFMDGESADITFEVAGGSEQGGSTHKKSKTSTAFHAHRFILQDGAPVLAELCKPIEGGGVTSVPIADVKADIFHLVLYYLYGGELSGAELEANAKEIIDAADRFGVVNLKLEAEACYVENAKFAVENILDNLLYAESKSCAHLKEAVMDFIVENGNDIIGEVSFDDVPSSVVTDLLVAMTRGKREDDVGSDGSNNYNAMRVSALRGKLHQKGLDVDGSREALIALLKKNF